MDVTGLPQSVGSDNPAPDNLGDNPGPPEILLALFLSVQLAGGLTIPNLYPERT